MREIKFRVWHKKRKKYYQVHHLHLDTIGTPDSPKEWATCKAFSCIEQKDIYIQVQPKECVLEQYVGLKDKNNEDWIEGDKAVLRNAFSGRIGESTEIFAIVKYFSGGFFFWNDEGCCEPLGNKPTAWEKIGNIHEGTK